MKYCTGFIYTALRKYCRVNRLCIMQISYVSLHVEEYTLTGVLSKFPDNKERPCAPKKIYWVVYRIETRERSIAVFNVWLSGIFVGQRLLCLIGSSVDTNSVVLCLGVTNYCDVWEPGLTLLRLGGTLYPLQILPCCPKTVHCSSSSSFALNIGIKYN